MPPTKPGTLIQRCQAPTPAGCGAGGPWTSITPAGERNDLQRDAFEGLRLVLPRPGDQPRRYLGVVQHRDRHHSVIAAAGAMGIPWRRSWRLGRPRSPLNSFVSGRLDAAPFFCLARTPGRTRASGGLAGESAILASVRPGS